jgi:hypothetical protein
MSHRTEDEAFTAESYTVSDRTILPKAIACERCGWEVWKSWIGEVRTLRIGINACSGNIIWAGEENCVEIFELKIWL